MESTDGESTGDEQLAKDVQRKGSLKYFQKYKLEWEMKWKWLKMENGLAYCKLCSKTLSNNISHLKRHNASNLHSRKEVQCKHQSLLPTCLSKQVDSQVSNDVVLRKEVSMVMFCVNNYLPLTTMDSLTDLFNATSDNSGKKTAMPLYQSC